MSNILDTALLFVMAACFAYISLRRSALGESTLTDVFDIVALAVFIVAMITMLTGVPSCSYRMPVILV